MPSTSADPKALPSIEPPATPDPPVAAGTCPDSVGDHATWPDGKAPEYMKGVHAVCFALPPGGAKACTKTYSSKCILGAFVCGKHEGGDTVLGALPSKDACCFKVRGQCAVGRPFIVDGEVVLAKVRSGNSWSGARAASLETEIEALDPSTRAVIAEVWARDALSEHASVASFAQLVLELLGHGAPSRLIEGAQRALAEEIEHAKRAFALASAYAGQALEPGKLRVEGALGGQRDLADFAARAAAEGCIAETYSALQLYAAADCSENAELAALLRKTADEESEHAVLAWEIVGWALAEGGAPVRNAVARVFEKAEGCIGFGACAEIDSADTRAHGILPREDREALALSALGSVIAPAARALLAERNEVNAVARA